MIVTYRFAGMCSHGNGRFFFVDMAGQPRQNCPLSIGHHSLRSSFLGGWCSQESRSRPSRASAKGFLEIWT